MQVKPSKERQKEEQYIDIQHQRKQYAGQNVFTIVVGNKVIPIGDNYNYELARDFLIDELEYHPRRIVEAGHFDDLIDAYDYVLTNCDDEDELKSFLKDYYSGIEMTDYD